jgi:hypothetical protein
MDLHNNIKVSRAISPKAAGTNNDAWVSEILDTANFAANELVIMIGANTDVDATFTVLLEEGDNSALSDNSAVADADMLGTEALASWTFADDNETRKLGYKGTKRYIRATVTPAANDSGNIYMAALWIQAGARVAPQS